MKNQLYELIGWLGFVLIVSAYLFLTIKWVALNSVTYHLLNLTGAMCMVGKRNTQKIERKDLNFRTWIKRLARRGICFSKLEGMHDVVIGLLINKVEFGRDIHA